MSTKTFSSIFLAFMLLTVLSCKTKEPSEEIGLIPLPQSVTVSKGYFNLNSKTSVYIDDEKIFQNDQKQFIEEINTIAGVSLNSVSATATKPAKNAIVIILDASLEEEAYTLEVTSKLITIEASSGAGAFYALQTIKQLLPVNLECNSCKIPALTITDKPAFGWRGYMLDVSRHFFEMDKLYEVVDFMAALKLNRFHIHLADDQGWRLEMDSYPKLTEIGAWRVDHNIYDENLSNWWGRPVQKENEKATYGGFYTKDEIRKLINYAKSKYIEIVPEIDVPGHSQEILASYPELACNHSKTYTVATGGVYKDNALCASNPKTYNFLEAVIAEVSELFPFEYIHIGGDECNKSGWKNHKACQDLIKKEGLKDEHELQSLFIKRVESIINKNGKHLIGWDEILEGGLAPNATVMSWRGEKGGIAAAKQGHNVIMSPNYANYLDLKQGQSDYEPNLGYSEALLSACYNYKVIPDELSEEEGKHILGTQGNLWTESISDWGKLTYMTFPRLFAVAENAWTKEESQNFEDFINRLKKQLLRFDADNIRYAKSIFKPWIHQVGNGETIELTLDSELPDSEIRFTLDGSLPSAESTQFTEPVLLSETSTLKAGIFENGKLLGDIVEERFIIHKAKGAKVVYRSKEPELKNANGPTALTDLCYGQFIGKNDKNWQTFTDNLDVEIQLEKATDISRITLNSMRFTHKGIYPFTEVVILGSTDGKKFNEIGKKEFREESLVQGRNKITNTIKCPAKGITNLQVQVKILEALPSEFAGRAKKIQMQLDEIIVE